MGQPATLGISRSADLSKTINDAMNRARVEIRFGLFLNGSQLRGQFNS